MKPTALLARYLLLAAWLLPAPGFGETEAPRQDRHVVAVAFVHDRQAEWSSAASKNFVKFAAAPMPAALREEMLRLLAPFPIESSQTDEPRNSFATRALTEIMWRDGVPAFSLLWLAEPD